MKLIKLFSIAVLALGIAMVSCSGEDGIDGKDGINGIKGQDGQDGKDGQDGEDGKDGEDGQDGQDGVDGQDGTDGQDGENGVGFDELTQYGYITLEMEGKRVDNVLFQDSTSFKFSAVQPVNIFDENMNHVSSSMVGDNLVYIFNIRRFLSTPDDVFQDAYMDIYLKMTNPGDENEILNNFEYRIKNYAVIGDDNKYFIIDHSYDELSPEILNLEVFNVAFEEETNHLTLQFSFTVTGAGNSTGNPLNMTGSIDVNLLEYIP